MTLALESIDPTAVPRRTLYTGAQIPAIGLGTFGSDHITSQQVATAVKDAIGVGYRHIDCASVYGNEKQIGDVFKSVISSGIERDDLWVTSKLWNTYHAAENGKIIFSNS